MRVRVLGAAAGGGFPQWNCGCEGCVTARRDPARARPRTQEGVAVSADGERWILLNASPEIRAQIEAFPPLHPRPPRQTPIAGIFVTNADLDHCLGLLSLREGTPLDVFATPAVRRAFAEGNVLCRALDRVAWRDLRPGQATKVAGLEVFAFPVPGKPPRYREGERPPSDEDTVALRIRDAEGRTVVYASSVGLVTPDVVERLSEADCVFFDGTCFSDDELALRGLSNRRARDMAHVPIGGPEGSLRALSGLRARRKIFIHVNNTNPILIEDSKERAAVSAEGWEVAWDGMEVSP